MANSGVTSPYSDSHTNNIA
ncbi:Protein of unknown function [Propionibacterium freudenreichii]|nr:Protein of unknown function [Propionibacterium freudenreichii]CEH10289.1 Protein of unknown function [Propionibacterium freudenreichii]